MDLPAHRPDLVARYTAAGWWSPETVSERVRAWASERAVEPAYRWPGDEGWCQLSWSGYDAAADRIAGALADLGLLRGARVLVFLPDGGAVHAAFLACERAGVVAVGVGWRAGRQELHHLLERSGASAAVAALATPLGAPDELDLPVARVVLDDLDDADGWAAGAPPVGPTIEPIGVDELWLLNSTSGTTGLPKCVMQTQNRWRYFHHKAVEFGELDPADSWMSVVPAPFGFGLWTAHVTPTLLGLPCVVMPRFDAAAVAEAIERWRVTVLCSVSSQFAMLLDAAGDRDLSSLRVLFTGGEAISSARARAFEQRCGCTVLNFYGSNETGLLSGTRVDDPVERRLTTGGRVVPEMQVRLFDADTGARLVGDVGRGVPACCGPATALGYWDDDEANAELVDSDGWMRMGDVVTIDPDGWLRVVGRTSDIIIRGGKNISAARVEDEVASHEAVALAAAVAVPDPRLGERVGVFVELAADPTVLGLAELREHLGGRGVSREWWPEHLWVLDELPRSSGGKVAKGELRDRAARLVAEPGVDGV
ncbi:MAG: acyl--CoA ligase [Acidimicrobiia bacterium]|nr:acyl--CoA ligase [Acidimicrobiia bacterium]